MKRIAHVGVERVIDAEYRGHDILGNFARSPLPDKYYIVRATGDLNGPDHKTYATKSKGIRLERNCCQYFIPCDQFPHTEIPVQLSSAQHAFRCWKRAEALKTGDWSFMGVRAFATIQTSTGDESCLNSQLSTEGVWGISSDAEESEFQSRETEQLKTLRNILLELGFSEEQFNDAYAISQGRNSQA